MTIAATITSKQYTSNGVTTQYAFPNKIFSAADLVVTLIDPAGNQYPFTNFANATTGLSYTVQGVDVDTGCTVVFSAAQTINWTIDIRSLIPDLQSTSIKNQGSFLPELHEEAFDRATRMIQDALRLAYLYGIHGPDIETVPWPALPGVTARKGMALMFDAGTGLPTLGVPNTQTITTGLLAPFLNLQQSPAEIAAGVMPTNLGFIEGVFERYGAVGDGTADDVTALNNAALVSAQGVRIYGTPGKTYKHTAAIAAGAFFDLQLRGATLKPTGNFQGITRSAGGIAAIATATVSSGATLGSRTVVVASATGLVVGQWVTFTSADANYQAGSWPSGYNKIQTIVGTTITLESPLGITYSTGGAISMFAYNDASYGALLRIVDGTIDLSASTFTTSGAALSVSGYKRVDIDIALIGQDQANTASTAMQFANCIDYRLRGYSRDNKSGGDIWDIQGGRSLTVREWQHDGFSFGFDIIRVDDVAVGQLIFRGRRASEVATPFSYRSIRGIKLIGCLSWNITGLIASDFTSGIKIESNVHGNIANVVLRNCLDTSGDVALNFGGTGTVNNQGGCNITNFILENCGGSGLYFSSPDNGRYAVSNFYIKNVVGYGIGSDAPDTLVSNGTIENWNTGGAVFGAVRCIQGGSFDNLTFRHTDNTKGCFSATLTAGKQFSFGHIRNPDGNPVFAGTTSVLESSGVATIPNGASTVNLTHNLIKQPTADQFTLTMNQGVLPTNQPGEIFISSISSSGAAIACRGVQGATGTTIAWKVRVPDTFTA